MLKFFKFNPNIIVSNSNKDYNKNELIYKCQSDFKKKNGFNPEKILFIDNKICNITNFTN